MHPLLILFFWLVLVGGAWFVCYTVSELLKPRWNKVFDLVAIPCFVIFAILTGSFAFVVLP